MYDVFAQIVSNALDLVHIKLKFECRKPQFSKYDSFRYRGGTYLSGTPCTFISATRGSVCPAKIIGEFQVERALGRELK